jgi:hypothetical protein
LGLLFLVDVARQNLAGVPGFEQAVLMVEMLAGNAALGYALTRGRLRPAAFEPRGDGDLSPVMRWTAYLVLGAFGVALIAGVLGYLRVGRLLAAGILSSGALALVFYACVLVGNGLVGVALQVWPLRLLQMVQRHRNLLARRTGTVLRWGASVGWTVRTLNYVGLLQPVLAAGAAILAARLERGAVSLSVGDVVEFVLVVWLAYLVSAFVRFVLEEDVFPRVRLPRGFSYALSRVYDPCSSPSGFLLGLGVLGLDLANSPFSRRRVQRRHQVRIAERGELRLGADLALRATDSRGRRHPYGRPGWGGAPDRHPGQRGTHVAGRRGHRSECPVDHGAGDELDAQRSASAHRPAGGGELWPRA